MVGDDWSMMNTSLDAEQEPPEAPETVEEEPEGTEPRFLCSRHSGGRTETVVVVEGIRKED